MKAKLIFVHEINKIKDKVYCYTYYCVGQKLAESVFFKAVVETYKEKVTTNKIRDLILKKIAQQAVDHKKAFLLLRIVGGFSWSEAEKIIGKRYSNDDLMETRRSFLKELEESIDHQHSRENICLMGSKFDSDNGRLKLF